MTVQYQYETICQTGYRYRYVHYGMKSKKGVVLNLAYRYLTDLTDGRTDGL